MKYFKWITTRPSKSQSKWLSDCTRCGINRSSVNLTMSFLCTRQTKQRTFKCKLILWRIATNSFLTKISISSNDLCCFCKETTETLLHLFWNKVTMWVKSLYCFKSAIFLFQSCLGLTKDISMFSWLPDTLFTNSNHQIQINQVQMKFVESFCTRESCCVSDQSWTFEKVG